MRFNFSAGPGHLDAAITKRVSASIENYKKSGLSILELSHRSEAIASIIEESKSRLRDYLNLGHDYEIIFMAGGASFQFYALPFNFLSKNEKAYYIDTGKWSSNSIREARRFGNIDVLGSSSDKNYSYIPEFETPSPGKYLHFTSNNTIYGTSFSKIPSTQLPVAADMSSDILGRPFEYDKMDLIYAGAQKNLGTAGVAIVAIKKDFLTHAKDNLPPMLSYKTMVEKNSLFNTPPVLAIYIVLETLRWIEDFGGIDKVYLNNKVKARTLYDAIDSSKVFYGTANKKDRSIMNVCFRCYDEKLEEEFLTFSATKGIAGIKGHRSSGGFRASLYNCIAQSYVDALIDAMKSFEQLHT